MGVKTDRIIPADDYGAVCERLSKHVFDLRAELHKTERKAKRIRESVEMLVPVLQALSKLDDAPAPSKPEPKADAPIATIVPDDDDIADVPEDDDAEDGTV